MPILRLDHPNLDGNETTRLTAAAVATATTLTVQNIEGFAVGNYLVLGKLGDEQTEIVRIHASTAPTGSTITLASATSFAHSVNTPVTYIAFNQVSIERATSKTGTYTEVSGSPVSIEADDDFTEFNDTGGTSDSWYRTRFQNSTTYSDYSDSIKGTGYTQNSLRRIIDKGNMIANDKNNKVLTEDEKIEIVNDGYEQTINRLERADHKRFIKKGYIDVKNSYDTGSVAVTVSGTTVTGTGTSWQIAWKNKKIIFGDEGFVYDITSINNANSLTISQAYQGTDDLTSEDYIIFQDEYDLIDAVTLVEVTDFKKIEQVKDEDGNIVNEYDLHRNEQGYYIKKEGENMKICLNYQLDTTNVEGRWEVQYRYQPTKLDTMADEPEFPQGYSGLLSSYLAGKIWERKSDLNKAGYYIGEFTALSNKLIRECSPRTNERKSFRLESKPYHRGRGTYKDGDWGNDEIEE